MKSLKILLVLIMVTLIFAVMSQLVGGFVLCSWLKQSFTWSVTFLLKAFSEHASYPANVQQAIFVSLGLSILVALIPLIMGLIMAISKPKR